MALDAHGPIEARVGEEVVLRLRQLDGVERLAFSVEAELIAGRVADGLADAAAFALDAPSAVGGVSEEAQGRAARYQVELTLALEAALLKVEGADWPTDRAGLARLVRYGDPPAGVPPLFLALGSWLRGPLLEVARAGELSEPSSDGDTAAGSNSATAALH